MGLSREDDDYTDDRRPLDSLTRLTGIRMAIKWTHEDDD
jgi:hypothetical protein